MQLRYSNQFRQSWKVIELVDPRMPVRHAHINMITVMSWLGLARLRRAWEERARKGLAAFIFGVALVALCARRTRGRALGSARPCPSRGWVPASQPASEGLPARQEQRRASRYAHPLTCPMPAARCPLPAVLTLFAKHLRSPSARHLEPYRPPWWPWRSSERRCR